MNTRPETHHRTGDTPAALEAGMLRALERIPSVAVPADFAKRVAARAVLEPLPKHSQWSGFGPRLALAGAVVLLVAMFAFAPHAAPSFRSLGFDLELAFLAELGAMACWFGAATPRD